jgi:hypothetical protein
MLTTVEGIFKDGRIELREVPPALGQARVIVTFLPEAPDATSPCPVSEANRRMLALLQAWQAEPLSPDEEHVFDELNLRFT